MKRGREKYRKGGKIKKKMRIQKKTMNEEKRKDGGIGRGVYRGSCRLT